MATEADRKAFDKEYWWSRWAGDGMAFDIAIHFWQAALDYAKRIVPDTAQQGIAWIPVCEAMPDESENEVLVLTTDGEYCIGWATWRHYTDGTAPHFDHWSFTDPDVTADVSFWAKLPAKPECRPND